MRAKSVCLKISPLYSPCPLWCILLKTGLWGKHIVTQKGSWERMCFLLVERGKEIFTDRVFHTSDSVPTLCILHLHWCTTIADCKSTSRPGVILVAFSYVSVPIPTIQSLNNLLCVCVCVSRGEAPSPGSTTAYTPKF